jgi:CsoR family transcriptional regulator, copper-sensing transcriptional repressor
LEPLHSREVTAAMAQFTGNQQQLIHRISGIEGHVRSLKKLLTEDREPLEILMQIASIRAAMERLSHVLFEEYVEATLQSIHTDDERTTAIADIRAALETLG